MKSLLGKVALILVLVFSIQVLTGTFAMAAQAQTAKLDPLLAALASFILPGLGQFLLGNQSRAINHVLVYLGIWIVGSLLAPYTYGVTAVLPLLWAIYSAYDAYQMAR